MLPWFSVLVVYLRAIFVFLSVFFSLRSSFLASYCCRKTLRYSQATVRSRINTARPLPSSNYRHRAKLHSRDLLNLINILFEFNSIHLFFSLYIIKSLPYLSFWFSLFELNVLSFISLSLSLHHQITPIWPFLSFDQLCPVSLTRLNFAARKTSDIYCPST